MDDFNKNNQTPNEHGEAYTDSQQPSEAQQQAYEQPASQAPEQQSAEPRTPFQTPVQHPDYVAPQQRADFNAQQDGAPQ